MTYHGKVQNGVVILDTGTKLPDGIEVRVEPVEDRPLMDLVGLAEQFPDDPAWPSDGAAEHDHYLYGTPKRNQ